ncbi:hypothetical protein [Paenibacillus sp. FJAT-27812]|uniref:hypothetical protein n=1 Tax=Paenibacillus sp. FJAT-27812 TaxID=1684143 RepID=UPI0012FC0FC9|nr:hypothetical protein [Paenibacillus sp. FJAT-27812]
MTSTSTTSLTVNWPIVVGATNYTAEIDGTPILAYIAKIGVPSTKRASPEND